jgi:hypothetical protein
MRGVRSRARDIVASVAGDVERRLTSKKRTKSYPRGLLSRAPCMTHAMASIASDTDYATVF